MRHVVYWLVMGIAAGAGVLIFSRGIARRNILWILFSLFVGAFIFFGWGGLILTSTDDNPCGGGGCDGPPPRIWSMNEALWAFTPPIIIGGILGAAIAATRDWDAKA